MLFFFLCLLFAISSVSCTTHSQENRIFHIVSEVHSNDESVPDEIDLPFVFGNDFDIPGNSEMQIVAEMDEEGTLKALACASGLTLQQIKEIDINTAQRKLTGKKGMIPILRKAAPNVDSYIQVRRLGHTKEYAISLMNSKASKPPISDPDLEKLLKECPEVAPDYVRKHGEGTSVYYIVSDNDIAWLYSNPIQEDGKVLNYYYERYDAKEFDPKYADLIKEVNEKVEARMKSEKDRGDGFLLFFLGLEKGDIKIKRH